jgi:hypothetical protein
MMAASEPPPNDFKDIARLENVQKYFGAPSMRYEISTCPLDTMRLSA